MLKIHKPQGWRLPWKRWTGLPVFRKGSAGKLDFSTFILFFSCLFLASFVVDAPLRWLLSLIKLAPLMYLRDVGVVVLLILEVQQALLRRRIRKVLWLLLLAVAFHFAVGVLFVGNLVQPLFGFKILLPLILGIMTGLRLRKTGRNGLFLRALLVLWGISLAGVLLQAMHVPMPWKGFSVEIGDMTISGNRAWTAQGIDRLSGFGRASFDTSLVLLLFPATFLFSLERRWRWVVLLASLLGIVLTTTKVTVLATLAAMALLGLLSFRLPFSRWIRLAVLALCAGITILPPILLRPGAFGIDLSDPVLLFALGSFMDRIYNTWPHGYEMLEALPLPWLGRGLGGVGAAQVYFEPANFCPGDNLYVYLLVGAGAFAWLYLAQLFRVGLPTRRKESRAPFFFISLIFVLGMTMNVIESAPALFLIGYWTVLRKAQPNVDSGTKGAASLA